MSEKDTIRDLFSDKLNGLESQVRPELWENISSQLGGSAAAASGMSMLTKLVLGVTTSAAVAVVAYYVVSGKETPQKTPSSIETSPFVNEEKSIKTTQDTPEQATENHTILSDDLTPNTPQYENPYISFDPVLEEVNERLDETIVAEETQLAPLVSASQVVTEGSVSTIESTENEMITQGSSTLELALPNTFTPNGDGVNEVLQLNISEDKIESGSFSCVVIDRAGRTVFQTTDLHFQWEGLSMNGEVVPTGDYVYYVTARDTEGKLITTYSTLHIVR